MDEIDVNFLFSSIFIRNDKNFSISFELAGEFSKVGLISGFSTVFIGATGPLIAPFFINDKFTKSIRELNDLISRDKRIEKVMVPFGDGMTVCRVL